MQHEVDKSWQMAGGPGNWLYEFYDALRRGLNQQITNRLARLALHKRGIVIEAGSGTGYATSLFADYPHATLSIAVDYDMAALEEGRRTDPNLCAVVADINALPFKAGAAQLVWNSSTIEHLDDQAHIVSEMARITKAEGVVFVGVPYKFGPLFFQRWIPETELGIWLGTVYKRQDINTWLTHSDCHPIDWWRYFFWFFVGVAGIKHPEK